MLGALPVDGLVILVTFSFFPPPESPVDTVLWAKPLGYSPAFVCTKITQVVKNTYPVAPVLGGSA